MKRILVTGALGQIGSDLVVALKQQAGVTLVLQSDIKPAGHGNQASYASLDVRNREQLEFLVVRNDIDTLFHLASLLSARGEQAPDLAWAINIEGLRNVLEIAHRHKVRVYWPSSIAVFGAGCPRECAPQHAILNPRTMYGVTKVTGELLGYYAYEAFGVDFRSVRYPGILSHKTLPGGGTTDYAIEMIIAALRKGRYTSYLAAETRLPMMYMPDAVRAALELMETEADRLSVRTSYNIAAVSFSVEELAAAIRKKIPQFECVYRPDFRQRIADSWPEDVDDTIARKEWSWKHNVGLDGMLDDMIAHLDGELSAAS